MFQKLTTFHMHSQYICTPATGPMGPLCQSPDSILSPSENSYFATILEFSPFPHGYPPSLANDAHFFNLPSETIMGLVMTMIASAESCSTSIHPPSLSCVHHPNLHLTWKDTARFCKRIAVQLEGGSLNKIPTIIFYQE